MKGFFYMLCVLYVVVAIQDAGAALMRGHALLVVKAVADLTLFGLCLQACHGLAFGRRKGRPGQWRLLSRGTLGLGVLAVLLTGWGEYVGLPPREGSTHLLNLFMAYLNYVLFAVPVILYENVLRKGESPA